jgi:hypothetical protein
LVVALARVSPPDERTFRTWITVDIIARLVGVAVDHRERLRGPGLPGVVECLMGTGPYPRPGPGLDVEQDVRAGEPAHLRKGPVRECCNGKRCEPLPHHRWNQ